MYLYNHQCFPIGTKQIKSVKLNRKPWFTSGLGKSVQKELKL